MANTNTKTNSNSNQSTENQRLSPLQRLSPFRLLKHVFTIFILSIFSSVLIEWIGMGFELWEQPGPNHAYLMVVSELAYVNQDFTDFVFLGYSPAELVDQSFNFIINGGQGDSYLGESLAKLNNWANQYTVGSIIHTAITTLRDYLLAAWLIIMVLAIRLTILFLSLPTFILFCFIGFIHGLKERDYRRWRIEREHSRRFHLALYFIKPSFALCWILYLSMPFSIHPNWIIQPTAALCAFLIAVAAKNYQKYY